MKNKMLLLAFANIRKRKSASISLFLLVLLATLMLSVGLNIFTRLDTFIQEKIVELNGADFIVNTVNDDELKKKEAFIKSYSATEKVEVEESISFPEAKMPFGGGDLAIKIIILNSDTNRTISQFKLIEKAADASGSQIYLPYTFKMGGGYKTGDTINITSEKEMYSYKVGGFFEETLIGSTLGGSIKVFLPDEEFEKLREKVNVKTRMKFISAILSDRSKASDLGNKYEKEFLTGSFSLDTSISTEFAEMNYTMAIKIIAVVIVAFALIILAVSLMVLKFRVSNSIEDEMVNIGSLKAAGYTSRQMIVSILTQFAIISIGASIVGIGATYAVFPMLGGIISSSVGLLWSTQITVENICICLAVVVLLVVIVTLTSAAKVIKITPIAALRSGIQTHSFKKNRFPLEKTKTNLQVALGMKAFAYSPKQNIFIILIVAVLCFTSIFCSIIYYNFAADRESLFNLAGSERCNVIIYLKDGLNSEEIVKDIEKMEGVKKTGMLSAEAAIINDKPVMLEVSDAFDKIEWDNIYEGRQPVYDNEVALSGMIAKAMNKSIGDSVEVFYKDKTAKYLITGLSQQIGNAGRIAAVTAEGYRRIRPDFKNREISVYLKEGYDSDRFIKEVYDKYNNLIYTPADLDAAAESQMGSIINALFSVMVLVMFMSLFVVSLILYLLIKTLIIKRKREFGIYKANGFTTLQLMTQVTVSFVPVVLIGAMLGGLIGYLYSNKMLSMLFYSLGLYNANFVVDIPSVALICSGMVVVAYIVSMLVSRKIKKITAYSLITE